MSTRASIFVVTPENQVREFYHHHDGYLSVVGEKLRRFLNGSANHDDLIKKLAAPRGLFSGGYKDEGLHTMDKFGKRHADIEFLYIIKNKKLYYMEIWGSKDYKKLETYGELVDYICIHKHAIDLSKEVADYDYIYTDNTPKDYIHKDNPPKDYTSKDYTSEDYTPEDNTPEDYTTKKTEDKTMNNTPEDNTPEDNTMNYTEKKNELENKIKELQNELEKLKKQESKEEWKKALADYFITFLKSLDFSIVDKINVTATAENGTAFYAAHFSLSDFIRLTAKKANETPEEKPAKAPAPATATAPVKAPAPATATAPVKAPAPATATAPAKAPAPAKVTISLDELIDSMK